MREFDLGSDADLNFVLPDEDGRSSSFWTRVAERMIDLITRVHRRRRDVHRRHAAAAQRTRGRAGADGRAATRSTSRSRAEAWEGITYMKSRAVVGNSRNGDAVPARAAGSRLAPVRPERAVANRSARDARAAGAGAGREQSAQGRPRRILRHRFRADVSAAEERRDFLSKC